MSSTSSVRPQTFTPNQLQELRQQIRGRVVAPDDAGYDAARQTWNVTTFDQRPALIVLPVHAADVVAAVAFAREHQLSIGVQGGGHGHPRPVDAALLVNFTDMVAVRIVPAPDGHSGGTAHVEAGVKWHDVIAAAHRHGLAPLNGFAGTVGVTGYTLGGGVGWLVREYGAASGSVRSAEVVTSDAQLLHVDEQSHADLLWGLRGGGGNFGIVTELEIELYPVKDVFGGFVVYPLSLGKDALSAYAAWTTRVPETLTSAVRLVHYPPAPQIPEPLRGVSAIAIMACYNGRTAEGEALVKPLRSIGTPLLDTFRRLPYAEIGTIANDPTEAPPVFTAADSGGLRDLSPDTIDSVLRIAGDRAGGVFLVEARHMGGALAHQTADAMAFSFRSPWFISALAAAPTHDALQVGRQTIETVFQALKPALTGERLINALEAGNAAPHVTRAAYYPENYERLVALKNRYDAGNMFCFNHNIAPSTAGTTP
jgi:hypothetical protein